MPKDHQMLYLLKAKVRNRLYLAIYNFELLGGESERNLTPMDIQGTVNNVEPQDSQSKVNDVNSNSNTIQATKKSYIIPKIWMDFDDFCSCFTSVVVFHNPRGYQYIHKYTDIKVKITYHFTLFSSL